MEDLHAGAKRHRILVVGHGTPLSGYGRVTYNLLNYLQHEFEVHHFAINVVEEIETGLAPWVQYPNLERFDPWGAAQLPKLVHNLKPALVLFIGDRIWHAASFRELRPFQQQGLKVVLYCPIEGHCVYPEALFAFTELDRLVVFTEFANRVVTENFSRLSTEGYHLPPVDIIPHGLDLSRFYPLANVPDRRMAARQQLLPSRPELHEGWWLLNANRCFPRKKLERTLEAFAQFSANKPANVRLVMLHLDKNNETQMKWVRQLDDQSRILTRHDFRLPIDDTQLNLIYNACEIGINSSSSEGWGLVAFEHGATGAAQIVPGHTACQDLWQDAGLLIEIENRVSSANGMFYEEVSAQSIADHMENLYRDLRLLKTKSFAAQRLVESPRFHWPTIADQWFAMLHGMLG